MSQKQRKQTFIPKTFQKKIILYNLLIVIAIATAISYYNFTSYKKDVIASETRISKTPSTFSPAAWNWPTEK